MDKENLEELRFYLPVIDKNFSAMREGLKDLTSLVSAVQTENALIKEQNTKINMELSNIKQEMAFIKASSKSNYIPIT